MHNWNRLLPVEGIIISPWIHYKDVNDISEQERLKVQKFFQQNKGYQDVRPVLKLVHRGSKVNRQYCIYVYRKRDLLGCILSREYIDNPDGYSLGDFECVKLLYPEFRDTKYSRYMFSDFMHMLFISQIAKRLYLYTLAKRTESTSFLDVADRERMPCIGQRFDSDSPDVQRYIIVRKKFDIEGIPFVIIEYNGDIYRSMDLYAYMKAVPGRSEEVIQAWISEMNLAATIIKDIKCTH